MASAWPFFTSFVSTTQLQSWDLLCALQIALHQKICIFHELNTFLLWKPWFAYLDPSPKGVLVRYSRHSLLDYTLRPFPSNDFSLHLDSTAHSETISHRRRTLQIKKCSHRVILSTSVFLKHFSCSTWQSLDYWLHVDISKTHTYFTSGQKPPDQIEYVSN